MCKNSSHEYGLIPMEVALSFSSFVNEVKHTIAVPQLNYCKCTVLAVAEKYWNN